MPIGYIFWLLMILIGVFGWCGYSAEPASPFRGRFFGASGLMLFVLLFLLGWKVFGFVAQ